MIDDISLSQSPTSYSLPGVLLGAGVDYLPRILHCWTDLPHGRIEVEISPVV